MDAPLRQSCAWLALTLATACAPPPEQPAPQPVPRETRAAPSTVPAEPFRDPIPPLPANAPATRYANLTPEACEAELEDRKLKVRRERKPRPDIDVAVRVRGPFNSVVVRKPARPSLFGLLDCRLALALDDLTAVLTEHDIIRLDIGSMYREGARIAHSGEPSQHASGLAMDILALRVQGGRMLVVERDWRANVGDVPCGPDAVMHEPNADAVLLRNVVCEVARRHIFHVMLTPSANRAHRDHFHFDITPEEEELTLR